MVSGRNQRGRKDRYIGPPDAPLFYAGRAAKDAVLAPVFGKYPVIALSHGTGASAMQMAWLGTYLAARGFIVVAVNHPGNNAVTGYTTQGFIEGWQRARDISTIISDMLKDRRFGTKIDPDRIGAAGFSYGGYTMMAQEPTCSGFWPGATNKRTLAIRLRCRIKWKSLRRSGSNPTCNKPCRTPAIPIAIHASEPSSPSFPLWLGRLHRKVCRRSRSPWRLS
jgi:hypothetical protein